MHDQQNLEQQSAHDQLLAVAVEPEDKEKKEKQRGKKEGRTSIKLQLVSILLIIGPSNTLGLGNIHTKRIPAKRSDGVHLASRRFCDSRRTVQRSECTPDETQIHYHRAWNPGLYNGRFRRKDTTRQAPHASSLGLV